jgi:hypothetical protein
MTDALFGVALWRMYQQTPNSKSSYLIRGGSNSGVYLSEVYDTPSVGATHTHTRATSQERVKSMY